jgi:hypothetical protein
MKKIFIILAVLMVLVLSGCFSSKNESLDNLVSLMMENYPSEDSNDEEAMKNLTYGSTFNFNDLEITIGESASVVNNGREGSFFSSSYVSDYVKLPIKIKNIADFSNELNSFDCNFFGPKGIAVINGMGSFEDERIENTSIRPGVVLEGFTYFLYDGDGEYVIEFGQKSKYEVKINVTK